MAEAGKLFEETLSIAEQWQQYTSSRPAPLTADEIKISWAEITAEREANKPIGTIAERWASRDL